VKQPLTDTFMALKINTWNMSNLRSITTDYESAALPTELRRQNIEIAYIPPFYVLSRQKSKPVKPCKNLSFERAFLDT